MSDARTRIEQAIADLLHRGGGTPEGVRAVVTRDRVDDPDRWQGWFREATGLPVLVSTETVFLLYRDAELHQTRAGVVVKLPPVLRAAVWVPADGAPPRGGYARRTAHDVPRGGPVMVPCPQCGVPRPIANVSNNVTRAARGRCITCGQADRAARLKGKRGAKA